MFEGTFSSDVDHEFFEDIYIEAPSSDQEATNIFAHLSSTGRLRHLALLCPPAKHRSHTSMLPLDFLVNAS